MVFLGLKPSSSSRATNLALILLCFVLLITTCHSFNRKVGLNVSMTTPQYYSGWSPAVATRYGSATSAGTDGGSCGYLSAVERPPFSGMVTAVGPPLYQSGLGCGVCYAIKCNDNPACSGNPVIVTATDSCPGCGSGHFDLSGIAFGAMAKYGQANQLRKVGVLQILYQRAECNYPGATLAFHVDPGPGAGPFYFSTVIEYADGDGELKTVELQPTGGRRTWLRMNQVWGALWKVNPGFKLEAPYSFRLTEAISGRTVVLYNVIPKWWKPGQTYRAASNFHT